MTMKLLSLLVTVSAVAVGIFIYPIIFTLIMFMMFNYTIEVLAVAK